MDFEFSQLRERVKSTGTTGRSGQRALGFFVALLLASSGVLAGEVEVPAADVGRPAGCGGPPWKITASPPVTRIRS